MSCDSTYKEKSSAAGQPAQGEEKGSVSRGISPVSPSRGWKKPLHQDGSSGLLTLRVERTPAAKESFSGHPNGFPWMIGPREGLYGI